LEYNNNKVTLLVDERVNKKGQTVVIAPKKGQGPSQAELRAKKKAEQEALAAQEKLLFNPVPTKAELEAKRKKEERDKAVAEGGAESSGEAYAHLQGEEDYRWTAEDFEPVEEDEERLEEQLAKELEELREKLESGAIVGTKVTAETFAKWKVQKRKEKEAAEKKAKAKALRTGALTGKMLYEMDESLFKDDEDAEEEYEREEEVPEGEAGEDGAEAPGAEKATEEDVDAALFEGDDLDDADDAEETAAAPGGEASADP